jgi:hypothetical protein
VKGDTVQYWEKKEDTPIRTLKLSGGARRAMKKAQVTTVEQLRELYESGQLRQCYGVGPQTVMEVGLKLGCEVPQDALEEPAPKPQRKAEKTVDHLIFRCDKWPELRVTIKPWLQAQLEVEMVRFRGGVLHLAQFAEKHDLTPEQIAEAEQLLLSKTWIYRENPLPGETITCHACGREFQSAALFRQHEFWAHGEELNVVRAQRPK